MALSNGKICNKCGINKPLNEFHKSKKTKDGVRLICKDCCKKYNEIRYNKNKEKINENNRKWRKNNKDRISECSREYRLKNKEKITIRMRSYRLMKKYGITEEQYNKLLNDQNGLCPICNLPLDNGSQIDVDHCHETEEIRGILHSLCNRALGCLNDDLNRFTNAMNYIQKHKKPFLRMVNSGIE